MRIQLGILFRWPILLAVLLICWSFFWERLLTRASKAPRTEAESAEAVKRREAQRQQGGCGACGGSYRPHG